MRVGMCICHVYACSVVHHSALYKVMIDCTVCCVLLCCVRIIIFLIRCVLLSPSGHYTKTGYGNVECSNNHAITTNNIHILGTKG